MFIQNEACSREKLSQTFTDLHNCFDQSFFGSTTVGGLSVREADLVLNPSVVFYLTAESTVTVLTILNNGLLVTCCEFS